jgi:hypothetical protein
MQTSFFPCEFLLHHSNCNFVLCIITTGEIVEIGTMRRLPEGFDGNTCPYIFTWSNERPNKIWGMGSGCSAYYNTVSHLAIILIEIKMFFSVIVSKYLSTVDSRIIVPQSKKDEANTEMKRYFDEDRFEIIALRDIEKDEELTHTYISLEWRECFSDLNKIVNG